MRYSRRENDRRNAPVVFEGKGWTWLRESWRVTLFLGMGTPTFKAQQGAFADGRHMVEVFTAFNNEASTVLKHADRLSAMGLEATNHNAA